MSANIKNYFPGIIILFIALLIALFSFKKYGVAWDEPLQRDMGLVSYNYVAQGDNSLFTYGDRDHGTAFEIPLIYFEKIFAITDSRKVYLMRHIVTHIFFLIGIFCGYILALKLFKKQYLACLGMMLLLCHPRIYAHSFFNSKDLPFLSAFLITMLLLQIAFDTKKWQWFAALAIVSAYATAIRVLGIMLPVVTLLLLSTDILREFFLKQKFQKEILNGLIYVFTFFSCLYLFWPLLWSAPIKHFSETFESLSKFRWGGLTLFRGHIYESTKIPAIYLPVWFAISTPLLYLIAGSTSLLFLAYKIITHLQNFIINGTDRAALVHLGLFIIPVAYIIYSGAVVYDDWRHVYFIYPAFVFLILFMLNSIKQVYIKSTLLLLLSIQIIGTTILMFQTYPYQHVYFNKVVPHKSEYLRHNYEMEYWGTSYKEGLEYILKNDTSAYIKVYGLWPLVNNNMLILKPEERKRIRMVWKEDNPNYFITVFRSHANDFEEYKTVYYEKKLFNSTIMRIYKLQ